MKKVWIGVALFVAAMVAVFGVLALTREKAPGDKQQKANFDAAMKAYKEAIEDSSDGATQRIIELSEKIESSDDYGRVEKAAKAYIKDLIVPYYTADDLQQSKLYKNGITTSLISEQQPDFVDAMDDSTKTIAALNALRDVADNMFLRDKAAEYLDEDLDQYYKDLFDSEVKEFYDNTKLKQQYFDLVNKMLPKAQYYDGILRFLIDNKGSWRLEDNKITFKTTKLTNLYNAMINNRNF